MRIEKTNTVGLVIDMQERLFPVMNEKGKLLSNCTTLISGLQILGVDMLVTQQYTKGLGETLSEISSLFPVFSYIEKTAFSCYDEPSFVEKLEEIGKKVVLICGIESHVCVLQTAVDLKSSGYFPVIISDCVSSRSTENISIALERFRYEGIMVTSSESILFELTRSAKASEFKAISKLVK